METQQECEILARLQMSTVRSGYDMEHNMDLAARSSCASIAQDFRPRNKLSSSISWLGLNIRPESANKSKYSTPSRRISLLRFRYFSSIALHYCTAISRDVRLKQLTHRTSSDTSWIIPRVSSAISMNATLKQTLLKLKRHSFTHSNETCTTGLKCDLMNAALST